MAAFATRETIETALRIGIPIAREIEEARHGASLRADIPEYEEDYDVVHDYDVDDNVNMQAYRPPDGRLTYEEAVTYSSAKIGQLGEGEVLSTLRERFSNIKHTGALAHSGDMQINCDFGRIIVEVKSYNSYVPRPQITKFLRDLSDTGASAGIFISLRSSIAGLREQFVIAHEHTHKFVPVIYLSYPNRDSMKLALTVLFQLLGAVDYINSIEATRTDMVERLCQVDGVASSLADSRRKCVDLSGEIASSLTNLIGDISRSESALRDISDNVRTNKESYDYSAILQEVQAHQRFTAYGPLVRTMLIKFIKQANKRVPRPMAPQWSNVGGKYTNKFTGHSFALRATSPEVGIPRSFLPDATVMQLLNAFSGDVAVGTDLRARLTAKNAEKIVSYA